MIDIAVCKDLITTHLGDGLSDIRHFTRSPIFFLFTSTALCGALVLGYTRIRKLIRVIRALENDLPTGLPNPRNICYLNALLQAMSSNASLVRFLQKSAKTRRCRLLYCLVCLLKGLRCSTQYLIANDLETLLRDMHALLLTELAQAQRWSADDQQDAHELFSFFMDIACCRQLGHTAIKASQGLTSISKFIGPRHERIVPRCFHRSRMNMAPNSYTTSSPLCTEVFQQHLLVHQVTCTKCDYRSSPVLQPEACLTVFFGPSPSQPPSTDRYTRHRGAVNANASASSAPTLSECLAKQFGTSEPLPDVRCPKCQSSNQPDDSQSAGLCQQERWIAHLPSCLVFHVQRNAWLHRPDSSWNPFGFGSKRLDFLHFAYRLNMTSYMLAARSRTHSQRVHRNDSGDHVACNSVYRVLNRQPRTYTLRSVLVHQGESMNSGHYIAYRTWRRKDPTRIAKDAAYVRFVRTLYASIYNFFHGIRRRGPVNSSPWIFTSDIYVLRVPSQEVRASLAFILFYERDSHAVRSDHGSRTTLVANPDQKTEGFDDTGLTGADELDDQDWDQIDRQRPIPLDTDTDDEEDPEDNESDGPSDTGDEDFVGCSRADVIRAYALAASST